MNQFNYIYEKVQNETLNKFLDRAFAEISKSVAAQKAAQEEALHISPVADEWSETFEATDENLAMLKNDDIIRINTNSSGMVWGAFKELFVESGFLAFQILMKKQKAEHYFFLNTEGGHPSYIGKFHYIDEAYEQARIVHPDVDGVVVTINKITDIIKQMV